MKLNNPIQVARDFAATLHKDRGQTYGDLPYTSHLDAVKDVLLRFDVIDKHLLTAAYLHDVCEDCEVSKTVIEELFGPKVAVVVHAVTDEPGENRKERKAKTYPKIKATPGALVVKLADRIANVEHSISANNIRMFKMYQKEQAEFSAKLRTIGEFDNFWNHLEVMIQTHSIPEMPKPVPAQVAPEI